MIDRLRGLPGVPLPEMNTALQELYKPCDCHALPSLADDDELMKAIRNMLRNVWRYKGIPEGYIDEEVTTLFAEKLWSAVAGNYGKNIVDIDWDTPDYNMLESLQKNVWNFSAAKNYQQLRELSNALIGEDGKLRTKKQFFDAAFSINEKHVKQYLSVEYEFAIASSQMAGKWVDIVANAENLPILEYDSVLDSQTTALCWSINGTRLRYDHPWWKIYYPPNHFGCRGTAKSLSSGQLTTLIPSADIPLMFQNNLAQSGLVFPQGHSYWQHLPGDVITNSDKLIPKLKK